MRSPRSLCASTLLLAGLGGLCLMACTGGVERPFVLTDAWVDDESDDDHTSDEAGQDAAPAVMDAGMLPKPRDAGSGGSAGSNAPKPSSICKTLDDNWSESANREAEKLVEALNFLRANRGQLCQRSNSGPPLMYRSELECAARQRLQGFAIPPRTMNPPTVRLNAGEDQRAFNDFYDRALKADFTEGLPYAELMIENANSLETAVNELVENLDFVCDYVTLPRVNLVGIAKVEHVWVIDLADSAPFGGRGGHP